LVSIDLGDDQYGNRYLTIFTPASLLALPFVDAAIHKFGFHTGPPQAINALSIANDILKVATNNLTVQSLEFALFSF
jgi:hypothetical protein